MPIILFHFNISLKTNIFTAYEEFERTPSVVQVFQHSKNKQKIEYAANDMHISISHLTVILLEIKSIGRFIFYINIYTIPLVTFIYLLLLYYYNRLIHLNRRISFLHYTCRYICTYVFSWVIKKKKKKTY